MMYFLRIIFWLIIVLATGLSIIRIICLKKPLFKGLEVWALAYPLGLGVVTLLMALLSWFRIKFSIGHITAGLLPLFAVALILILLSKKKPVASGSRLPAQRFSFWERFFLGCIVFQVAFVFFQALIVPIDAYDALDMFAFKAKIFYLSGMIPADFVERFTHILRHLEYPLHLPLAEASFYTFLGRLDDLAVKIIFPLYYVSCLAIFFYTGCRWFGRKTALLFTFLLATVPQFCDYAGNGYAEIILSFYFTASAFYLWLWMRQRRIQFLVLSGLFSVLMIWTKTSGLMLLGVNMAVMLIMLFNERWRNCLPGILYIGFSSLTILAYFLIIKSVNLIVHEDIGGLSLLGLPFLYIKNLTQRIIPIFYEYQIQFFGPKKWNLIWVIFFLFVFFRAKQLFKNENKYLISTIILVFIGYTSMYVLTNQHLGYMLSTSASRVFIHILPVVVFYCAVMFNTGDKKGVRVN